MLYNTDSHKNSSLDSIFTYETAAPLSEEQEAALIAAAQQGDNDAWLSLARAYGPTLRKQSGRAAKTLNKEDKAYSKEEAHDLALLAFTEVVMTHDLHSEVYNARIAGRLVTKLRETFGEAVSSSTVMTISKRHYTRYIGIMQQADQDIDAAYVIAQSAPGMDPATFLAIHRAVQGTSLDASGTTDDGSHIESAKVRPVVSLTDDSYIEAEDAVLIEAAFDAVSDEEERIISLHYGFRGVQRDEDGINYAQGEVIPDAVIAKVVGSSQPTVNRKRAAGLAKMRKALGVTPA